MKKFAIIEIGSYNTKTPDGVYDLNIKKRLNLCLFLLFKNTKNDIIIISIMDGV